VAYSGSWPALRGVRAAGTVAAALVLGGEKAHGEAPEAAQSPPRVETWSGGEVFRHVRSVYGGATVAPFGGVQEDGFRLRGVLGYADYGKGTMAFGDVLIGYHKQLGSVTGKIFGGLTVTDHVPDPGEPFAALRGTEHGGKGVLEAWWNITDQAWASADLSFGSTHMDYGGRIRAGWRLWPELSVGVEGGSGGTVEPDLRDTARIGGFLRYEWATGEVSVSGGWSAEGTWLERDGPAPFATVSLLTRF
jgi:cellulose biosynthesis protein BcsS